MDTLREHLLELRTADARAIDAALAASEKAVEVTEATNQRWGEAANEWRGAMDDRDRASAEANRQFVQRVEIELMLRAIDDKMSEMKKDIRGNQDQLSSLLGRSSGVTAAWGYLVGAIGIAAAVVALLSR